MLERDIASRECRVCPPQIDRQRGRLPQDAARRAFVHAKGCREFGGAGTIGPLPVLAIAARRMRLNLAHQYAQFMNPFDLLGLGGADRPLERGDSVERLCESRGWLHVSIRPRPTDIGFGL